MYSTNSWKLRSVNGRKLKLLIFSRRSRNKPLLILVSLSSSGLVQRQRNMPPEKLEMVLNELCSLVRVESVANTGTELRNTDVCRKVRNLILKLKPCSIRPEQFLDQIRAEYGERFELYIVCSANYRKKKMKVGGKLRDEILQKFLCNAENDRKLADASNLVIVPSRSSGSGLGELEEVLTNYFEKVEEKYGRRASEVIRGAVENTVSDILKLHREGEPELKIRDEIVKIRSHAVPAISFGKIRAYLAVKPENPLYDLEPLELRTNEVEAVRLDVRLKFRGRTNLVSVGATLYYIPLLNAVFQYGKNEFRRREQGGSKRSTGTRKYRKLSKRREKW